MKFEIDVTEEMVLRAIREEICLTEYDNDGDVIRRGLDVREIVKTHVQRAAENAIAAEIGNGLREQIGKQIAAALEEGFQPVTSWGSPTGERVILKTLVAKPLQEQTSSYERKSVRDLIIEHAKREVETQVKSMVAEAKRQIENELTACAAEALKTYMRKHAGV